MSAYLSAWRAMRGKISLTWIPGTLVEMALKGPRTSSGALGLGSQVSMWLGPPTRSSMMQLTSLSCPGLGAAGVAEAAALRAKKSGNARPRAERAPAWRKSRRVRPSQKETERLASRRNMGHHLREDLRRESRQNA